jgi:hypothetical protein
MALGKAQEVIHIYINVSEQLLRDETLKWLGMARLARPRQYEGVLRQFTGMGAVQECDGGFLLGKGRSGNAVECATGRGADHQETSFKSLGLSAVLLSGWENG